MDQEGRLSGDPRFIKLVEQAGPAGRPDDRSAARRVSVALAWLGVLGLVVL